MFWITCNSRSHDIHHFDFQTEIVRTVQCRQQWQYVCFRKVTNYVIETIDEHGVHFVLKTKRARKMKLERNFHRNTLFAIDINACVDCTLSVVHTVPVYR